MREAFKGLPLDLRKVEDLFKLISSRVPGSRVLSASSDSTTYLGIQLGDEVLLDLRVSSAVVEVYVAGRLLDALKDIGLTEVFEVLEKYGASIKSVSISKAIPSGSLYMVVQGDGVGLPNIRLVVTRDFFDLSSSFCRISSTENTCLLLTKVHELGRMYFEDFFR